MNLILNVSDHVLNINLPVRDKLGKVLYYNTLTKSETKEKIELEVSYILSRRIAAGQLDATKEQSLFVSTKFGAASVTIIPRSNFQ